MADEIWLVNMWEPWVVELLPDSIMNMNNKFEALVRIFGVKHFGVINQRKIVSIDASVRQTYVQKISEKMYKVNLLLNKTLSDYPYYYSLLNLSCGGNAKRCKVFDNEGLLISPDGGHLTKSGAIELGQRLNSILLEVSVILPKNKLIDNVESIALVPPA